MLLASLFALVGCDDTVFPPVTGGGGTQGDGFCAVQLIFANNCVTCHSASGAAGGLDLETDPHAALVGIASAGWPGHTLVVAGDPDGSLLYVKVSGAADPATEGGNMPPGSVIATEDVDLVRAWIADGATDACDSIDTGSEGYHPAGWDAPTAHGLAAKLNEQECRSCHGEALDGGDAAISCDTCHAATSEDWRTDCTFCHGGADDTTGAPPEGIRDETDPSLLAFPPHATHVQATDLKAALDCVQCHVKPDSALADGHVLVGDTSPGVADVTFAAGLSESASWDHASRTCTNLYCHGDGQGDNGTMVATGDASCGSCHAVYESDRDPRWSDMSGRHEEHLDEGLVCANCHGEVVTSTGTIAHVEKHVNGEVDVLLPSSVVRTGNTCNGTCHLGEEDEVHVGRTWN